MSIGPPPGQPLGDKNIPHVHTIDFDRGKRPSEAVYSESLNRKLVVVQKLEHAGAGAVSKGNFALATANVVIRFWGVVAFET